TPRRCRGGQERLLQPPFAQTLQPSPIPKMIPPSPSLLVPHSVSSRNEPNRSTFGFSYIAHLLGVEPRAPGPYGPRSSWPRESLRVPSGSHHHLPITAPASRSTDGRRTRPLPRPAL